MLVILALLFPHFAWYAVTRAERSALRSSYAVEEARFLIEAVEQHEARGSTEPLPWRLRTIPLDSALIPPVDNDAGSDNTPVEHFRDRLLARMPPGTQVRISAPSLGKDPMLWVLSPGQPNWVVMTVRPPPPPRPQGDRLFIWLASSFSAVVLLALFAAWRLQDPIRKLAVAASRFGQGRDVAPLKEEGPAEFRMLTRRFNRMIADISQNETDRGIMLAGVAHDLKAPLARLRLRAEMVDNDKQRDGFVRDVDSLAHIVDQFLVFAHDGADQSARQGVDAYCERFARNYQSAWPQRAPLQLALQAGEAFQLSVATLDRLLTNLVDNAYNYGQPPVRITTGRCAPSVAGDPRHDEADGGQQWYIRVSDEGAGIPDAALGTASRPFVRLDPARGGSAHCGLGLAIVERLASRAGGSCLLSNGQHQPGTPESVSDATIETTGSGLRVELRFPMSSLQESHRGAP
jgi:two-component system osmolarity sensor histidine kinase EnvZ